MAAQGLGPGLQGYATAHAAHALLQPHAQHHQQHPVDPYIQLMPSLSLDSFFGAYDERDMAAQRAQAPPPMMENVLPAWEDLSNGPSNSLQAGADWRVRACPPLYTACCLCFATSMLAPLVSFVCGPVLLQQS